MVEHRRNRLIGSHEEGVVWEISDMSYNDGILMASEEHHLTVIILNFNKPITAFAITKENTRQLKFLFKKKEKELPAHLTDLSEFFSRNDSYLYRRHGK